MILGWNVVIEGDTVTISGHTIDTGADGLSGNSGAAGSITIEGYTIDIDNATLDAIGSTSSGSITIDALDDRANFTTGFANIDSVDAQVNVGLTGNTVIEGGQVTIEATAHSQHYFTESDFQNFDIIGSLKIKASQEQGAVDDILGGLEDVSLFVAVTISKATADVDVGQYAQITATDFTADSLAIASAKADPQAWGLGVAYGEVDTTALVTIAGSVTTSGWADINATANNTIDVTSKATAIAGYNASAAISVVNSNATADVTPTAKLTIGGDLAIEGQRTDSNTTTATSNSDEKGKLGVAFALSLETEQTNAYLDGTASAADISVSTTTQSTPSVTAGAGVGAGTQAGSNLTKQYESALETKITTPITNAVTKLYTGSALDKWISNS